MKNISKNILALSIIGGLSITSIANATDLQMDLSAYNATYGQYAPLDIADTDRITGMFQKFTFDTVNPTSTYLDINGDGGIGNGDIVFDTANDVVVGNLNFTGDSEVFVT